VDNELEVIRSQMEETRSSLADKLEAIETQFKDTVEGASSAVANTVENVQDAVVTVQETLDVRKHVENHPWAMMGGAFGVGLLTGYFLGPSRKEEPVQNEPAAAFTPRSNGTGGHNGFHEREEPAAEEEEDGPIQSGLRLIKGLALGSIMGVLRQIALQVVPTEMASDVRGMVDDWTTRMGGKPFQGTERDDAGIGSREAEAEHVRRHDSEMGGTVGATRW